MKKNLLIALFSLCLVLSLVALPFLAGRAKPAPTPAPKTLDIGVLAALTGFGSAAEVPISQGAEVAQEYFNQKGGIKIKGAPYNIRLHIEDVKGTADGTVAAATKLVYNDKVKFVVGTVVPYMVEAAGTVTEPAKVLHISAYNCAVPSEYGPKTPYTFMGQASTVEGTAICMKYLTEAYPKAKKLAITIPDDGSIPYLGPIVKRDAEALGLTVVGDVVKWTHDTVDFTATATKILALKPDAVAMVNGWPQPVGGILKAAREQGFTGPMFAAHNAAPDIATVAGLAASNDYFATGIIANDPGMTPMIKELAPKFQGKYGNISYYHFWGFQIVDVLRQGIEAAQSLDPTAVRNALEKMKTLPTLYGTAQMGGLKTYGIKHTVCNPLPIQDLQRVYRSTLNG